MTMPPLGRRKTGKFELARRNQPTEIRTPEPAKSGGSGSKPPTGGSSSAGATPPDGPGPQGTSLVPQPSGSGKSYNLWVQIKDRIVSEYGNFKAWWNSQSKGKRIAWFVGTIAALGIPAWALYEWLKNDAGVDASEEAKAAAEQSAPDSVQQGQELESGMTAVVGDHTTGISRSGTSAGAFSTAEVMELIKMLTCGCHHDDGVRAGSVSIEYDLIMKPKNSQRYVGGGNQDW
jgi:hypothetical protein